MAVKTKDEIKTITEYITGRFKPVKVILFGSYAYGTPGENSDVDILVIAKDGEDIDAKEVRAAVREKFGYADSFDIIVRTESYLNERAKDGDFFVNEMIDKGMEL
ncbi:MAG TPA: nucleotidyltransferase domain-containing protein [Candidatus Goldiibacteriota bacterium]|nr:nucleotidyltransferase domain-containing protein [Candidatus Goldiibacteriota bacterium]HPI03484.1 nucleotidyltransferase domain-containing protein [Candidatus Goldiibacteriota bacterium]HPN65269.1 nucleotidyltransferase domain-containing protein [Candidatus Goldiibacteriota bacterium]HRQ43540.1 nucleotidyltransferase domain-containing protein [Candidatus Goldiibacteriota bacterium]